MVATARLLKDALGAHELPPEVAARHIQRALTPAKHRPTRRRSRSRARVAVTVLLAATLLVSMTAMTAVASANALPGQLLYPAKRATEQVRLALAASPSDRAEIRLDLAQTRLAELRELAHSGEPGYLPGAITAMQAAVREANIAVTRVAETGPSSAADLRSQWMGLRQEMVVELRQLIAGPPTSSPPQAEAITNAATSVLSSWGIPSPPQGVPAPGQPSAGGPPPVGVVPSSTTTTTTTLPTPKGTTSTTTTSSTTTTTVPPTTEGTTSSTTTRSSTTTTVPPPTQEAPSSTATPTAPSTNQGATTVSTITSTRATADGHPNVRHSTGWRNGARMRTDRGRDFRPPAAVAASRVVWAGEMPPERPGRP
jgi:Domain of unknown function (DUF5667)